MARSNESPGTEIAQVFLTDEARLTALAETHEALLADEVSPAIKIAATLETARGLIETIAAEKLRIEGSATPAAEILRMELNEGQQQTLRLARLFSEKSRPEAIGSAALHV